MKQNSKKATPPALPKGTCILPMHSGHPQQIPSIHYPLVQPPVVPFQQQPMLLQNQQFQPQQQPNQQQQQQQQKQYQQHPPGCMALPSTSKQQPQQNAYMRQQPVQLSSEGTSAGTPIYLGTSSSMVHQAGQSLGSANHPATAPMGYHQTSPYQSPLPPNNVYQPTVADHVQRPTGFSGGQQSYKQQQQQQQPYRYQPMQPYQDAPVQLPGQPSFHPEGSSSDGQYFFDANCTVPVVQQPSQPSQTGCRHPSCTSCKSFKRN